MSPENFISEIYIRSNPATEEKVCVGLMGLSANRAFFRYSEKKLRLTNRLVGEEVKNSLERSFKSFQQEVKRLNKEMDESNLIRESPLDFNFFNYLHTYGKGLVYYTSPKPIATKLNDKNFSRLFELHVGDSGETEKKKVSTLQSKVSEALKRETFTKRTDTHYKLEPDIVKTIYLSHEIDFICKNGNLFAGKGIDFNTAATTIEYNLYEFNRVAKGLKNLAEKRKLTFKGRYEVYFNNPESREGKEMLDRVRKDATRHFELKEVEKLDHVEKDIEEGGYEKFSEWIGEWSNRNDEVALVIP